MVTLIVTFSNLETQSTLIILTFNLLRTMHILSFSVISVFNLNIYLNTFTLTYKPGSCFIGP